jgi:chemotaxis protein CheD
MAAVNEVLPEIYLYPGETQLVSQPTIIRTVLGSCVSVAFWAPSVGASALCHAMLPNAPLGARIEASQGRRYVDFAIRELARRFDSLGALRSEVQVKVFGGGDVLMVMVTANSARRTVGRMNIDVALEVLSEEGFTVAASSLGGTCGIHISFNTGTGEVRLRRLSI